ncbi:hypothetical protein FKM82_013499 [Ascaphus truei]
MLICIFGEIINMLSTYTVCNDSIRASCYCVSDTLQVEGIHCKRFFKSPMVTVLLGVGDLCWNHLRMFTTVFNQMH